MISENEKTNGMELQLNVILMAHMASYAFTARSLKTPQTTKIDDLWIDKWLCHLILQDAVNSKYGFCL